MLGIEFGGDVIEQQEGEFVAPIAGYGVLAKLEGEGREAELAARADVGQEPSIEPGLEVIAMRAEAGDPALDILIASL